MAKTSYIYQMVDTWTKATETYTAIKMDVADNASSASSLLLDLQVDSVSKLSVDKNGNLIVGGTLDVQGGIAIGGNFNFDDNEKLLFGDDDDLEIYHDGLNSYITDTGTGDLILTSDNVTVVGSLLAAQSGAGANAFAAGPNAGATSQGDYAVALGLQAGQTSQGLQSVALGRAAGRTTQSGYAVALGGYAGETAQSGGGTAIGFYAGRYNQGTQAVALGYLAGQTSQGISSIAIGRSAGRTSQGTYALAIGREAGETTQGSYASALGYQAGQTTQGSFATAVGYFAGKTLQGNYAIALGTNAGETSQGANGIILNATGAALDDTTAGHVHIASSLASLDYDGTDWLISGGNLGVGITAPVGAKLSANGTIRAEGLTTISGGKGTEIRYDTSGDWGGILAYDRGSAAYKELRVEGSIIKFTESGTDVMTITSNNVGIGQTPTADLHLNADATTTNAFQIEADTVTTGNVIDVVNADALTTGGILDLVSNSSDTGTRNLVNIRNGNSAATGAVPLKVEQDANQTGIELTSDCTTEPGLLVQANSLTTGAAIYGYSDSSATGSLRGVIRGRQASTSAVSSYVGYFQQKSTQSVLGLEKDATTGGGFIDYRGDEGANTTDPVSTHGTAGTIQKWIQVEVNGTKYWMPVYSAPSA